MVTFFLERTCGRPFSFHFDVAEGYTSYARPILVDLIVHSEQWEEVSIGLWPSQFGYLCGAKGHLSLLKKLDIHYDVGRDEDYGGAGNAVRSMVANTFEDAPLLTHVVLHTPSPWQFKFNWSLLTMVTLQHYSNIPNNILPVLRKTINLVELTIQHMPLNDLDNEGDGLVHLPHLERLSINRLAFWTILETPSLQRLTIDFTLSQPSLNDTGVIVPFFRRSEIELTTLVLKHGPAAIVKEILRFTPKIYKLVLLEIFDTADVFEWLAGTGTQLQEPQCSNLNVLWAYLTPIEVREVLEALHNMIARRNPSGDVRDPSPRQVIIQPRHEGQDVAVDLELLCRDRGIRFDFIRQTFPTLTLYDL